MLAPFRSSRLKIPHVRGTATVQGLLSIHLTSSLGSSACPEPVIQHLWHNHSRKTTGEYRDMISFKASIIHRRCCYDRECLPRGGIKGGKDLLDDAGFEKYVHGSLTDKFYPGEDVIDLQNPYRRPPASILSTSTKASTQQTNVKQLTKPKPVAVNTIRKAAVPRRSIYPILVYLP